MSTLTVYLLGIATPFAVALLVAVVLEAIGWFASTSTAYGCGTCGRWWGPEYDGSRSWIASVRSSWHHSTAHPGVNGRSLVALWRGTDWMLERRLNRAFPSPRVTVFDLVARTPVLRGIARGIARSHGGGR